MTECTCQIFRHADGHDLLFVCPMHYGKMLDDSSVDYGLCTNVGANKELNEKYGVPIVTPKDYTFTDYMMKPSGWKRK